MFKKNTVLDFVCILLHVCIIIQKCSFSDDLWIVWFCCSFHVSTTVLCTSWIVLVGVNNRSLHDVCRRRKKENKVLFQSSPTNHVKLQHNKEMT